MSVAASTTILKIPTELRAIIYGYVFEEHWEKHGRHVGVDSPPGCRMSDPEHIWDAVERQRAERPSPVKEYKHNSGYSGLDPPILHTCKSIYREGHDEYRKFLKTRRDFGPDGPGARNRACIRLRRYKKCETGYRLDGREPWLYLRDLRFSRSKGNFAGESTAEHVGVNLESLQRTDTTILTIPPELRVLIYEHAFEMHWSSHARHVFDEPSDPPDLFTPKRSMNNISFQRSQNGEEYLQNPSEFCGLEAPMLKTCKLFRKEGLPEYEKFLEAKRDTEPGWAGISRSLRSRARRHEKCSKDCTFNYRSEFLSAMERQGEYSKPRREWSAVEVESARFELERRGKVEKYAAEMGKGRDQYDGVQ